MSRSLVLSLAAAALLAACSDLSDRDTITLRAGNAIHGSRAIHTVDPQATAANDTRFATDARVTANVMNRYREYGTQAAPDPAPAEAGGAANGGGSGGPPTR